MIRVEGVRARAVHDAPASLLSQQQQGRRSMWCHSCLRGSDAIPTSKAAAHPGLADRNWQCSLCSTQLVVLWSGTGTSSCVLAYIAHLTAVS